jgi:F-type H+-transporting ATPase subunit epsilon
MPRLKLDVVTGERQVYSGDVDAVIAPGVEGELGILPRHAPLLTMLEPGVLRIRQGDDELALAISGGFLEVQPNRVIVLADTAERADEIDVARASAGVEQARALLAQRGKVPPGEFEQAVARMRRSEVRLKVARRRRLGESHGRSPGN